MVEVEEFKQFDVVSDFTDHYYYGPSVSIISSNARKKIMREWKILENNLPESIFVRAYEGRMDLLRAVIIGAAGTPYHDGLFFFDILFPSDYPARPPQVHYHSHGLRINPNLYKSGYVCLSLLNTWHGHKNEKWNSSASTVLQVLVSIQALVLNENPFFNEPGAIHWSSSTKASSDYNETAFVLSCRTMLYLLQKPPKNFERFLVDHFRKRGEAILTACRAYRDGFAKVGGVVHVQSGGDTATPSFAVSKDMVKWMDDLYPVLVKAFEKNGASPESFLLEQEENLEAETETAEQKTSSSSRVIVDKLLVRSPEMQQRTYSTTPHQVIVNKKKDGFLKGSFISKLISKMLCLK
ncbi:PREDICTED: putative ubiquitin-conjugating enzyme E2 38 [Nelumbo nucifera]|uniref:Ubiquitin-conjugating enzyme E2 38 n=2 Tax=Nelumbo nucifera TaxID=4432 RepID=A0A1U8AKS5_NELNU|nr:PREDICTED: putative ubiquitin-conjugating enzyme E2 38 [Nelumbo nucifera]DAD33081.1 TPA_asm: hypothetical protein HUJ06_011932 [Nelumbo nucifera]